MKEKSIAKSAFFMLVTVTAIVSGYEIYLRNSGVGIAYDDGPALWSDKRAEVYAPKEESVVFIGSSRIKFDLDIPTWEKETGLHATQLAIVGSNPCPLLQDLADDPKFRGKLIVDVTEPLFFSGAPQYSENPNKNIKYFHERTLAQQASFHLNALLESRFVFLDKDNLSMNARLDALQIPNREGVFAMPIFPMDFDRTDFDRQTYMTDRFTSDPALIGQVRGIWYGLCAAPKGPPLTDAGIDAVLQSVKKSVDKIRARGGEVVFVRTPSSGPFLEGEKMGFPREKYWNRILEVTGCQGFHFADYPQTAHFTCPEFSHLNRRDARAFTHEFIGILSAKTSWKLPLVQQKQKI